METIYKATTDVDSDTNQMTYSTEWFVNGVCCTLAIMLTVLSCEAFLPVSFLALPFTLIWKPVFGIFIFWFIAFYALAYNLKK
jgi:hypothetical protein